jgi:hypothetical protein
MEIEMDTENKQHETEVTIESLDLANKALIGERDSATKRAEAAEARVKELEDRVVDLEVEALVGVRITPAEKAQFVRARKLDKDLFDQMLSTKPADLGLTRSVLPAESIANGGRNLNAVEIDAFAIAAKAK